ncbi:MAG: 30S ribosomal protein S2 [Candidatus Daviesbacteria bacterium]|nr:30S ribosomal protein S2 [Candidatus Daviesbacteria bacterium]
MSTVPTMQDLLEAGVHFGHQVRRGHPRMQEYIFGVRDGVHIINLEDSEKLLQEACAVAHKLGEEGKVLLFVGTKKQAQPITKELAIRVGAPYVDYKWMAGILTNFEEMRRNIKKLQDLQDKQGKGELSHYTKKEQLLITRKLEKFEIEYGGVVKMEALPDALFMIDSVAEKTALAEAIRLKIPVIALCDSNSNPALVDYPIPGNDDATKSIIILTEAIANSYEEGLKKSRVVKVEGKKEDSSAGASVVVPPAEVAVLEEVVEKEVIKDSKAIV